MNLWEKVKVLGRAKVISDLKIGVISFSMPLNYRDTLFVKVSMVIRSTLSCRSNQLSKRRK